MSAYNSTVSPLAKLRRSARKQSGNWLALAVLIPLALIWTIPLIMMISTSLKNQAEVYQPMKIIPEVLLWGNYPTALFDFLPFPTFFKNSFIISGAVIIGDVLSAAFVAYGFARLRFPGRDVLFIVLLSTMIIPFAVRMIPLFLVFKWLGWINTFLPLTAPSFVGNPLFIFLVREFYKGIPQELTDAARIDGANEFQIWWKVMLPLSKPVLAVVAILAFQHSWNDFLQPLIFLNETEKFTATLGLYTLIGGNDAPQAWQYLMAATLVTILPVVALFFAAQRYFISGVTLSGMKG
jgi:ABC-type glycerol-3-phosphate transport system permease component